MWTLINQTPFAAERAFARAIDGAEVWLVAVRATFVIAADGTVALADEQEPVRQGALYWGEPGKSSLRYDADLVRTKRGTDVLLHGRAHAPRGAAVTETHVTLVAGPIRKTLRVVGDRLWEDGRNGLTLSDPAPFESMPLTYERAYGGSLAEPPQREARNPVGRGFAPKERRPGTWAPNVEYPGEPTRPAGFGPIAPDWSPRRERAGTYDDDWKQKRLPLPPLDFDDTFFHSAPDDQHVPGYLKGGERVEVINATPDGRLQFTLPQVSLGFATRFSGYREHHRGVLHTVIMEPDERRLQMVWHTSLPCHFTAYRLRDTTVFMKRRLGSLADTTEVWQPATPSPMA